MACLLRRTIVPIGVTSTPFLCSGLLQECAWCWAAWFFPTGGTPRWSGTCAASRRGNTHWATARYAGPICWPSWASWTPSSCLSWPSSWATDRRTSIWMICRQTTKVSKRNNNWNFCYKSRVPPKTILNIRKKPGGKQEILQEKDRLLFFELNWELKTQPKTQTLTKTLFSRHLWDVSILCIRFTFSRILHNKNKEQDEHVIHDKEE